MATLIKRGKKWSIKMYDASGNQKWITGYSDKAETQKLANRLENEKTQIQRGDIDPQHEQRKTERAKATTDHLAEYKSALQAAGNSANHVSYTIADIEKFIAHSGATHAAGITRPMLDSWSLNLQTTKQPDRYGKPQQDSRRTVNRRVGSVQAFLKKLVEMGTLTDYVLHKFG